MHTVVLHIGWSRLTCSFSALLLSDKIAKSTNSITRRWDKEYQDEKGYTYSRDERTES